MDRVHLSWGVLLWTKLHPIPLSSKWKIYSNHVIKCRHGFIYGTVLMIWQTTFNHYQAIRVWKGTRSGTFIFLLRSGYFSKTVMRYIPRDLTSCFALWQQPPPEPVLIPPNDVVWRQRSGSTLAQVMACCLTAPSHYLNQCWLINSEVTSHSYQGNFTRDDSTINH